MHVRQQFPRLCSRNILFTRSGVNRQRSAQEKLTGEFFRSAVSGLLIRTCRSYEVTLICLRLFLTCSGRGVRVYLTSFYASGPPVVKLNPILFGVSCRDNLQGLPPKEPAPMTTGAGRFFKEGVGAGPPLQGTAKGSTKGRHRAYPIWKEQTSPVFKATFVYLRFLKVRSFNFGEFRHFREGACVHVVGNLRHFVGASSVINHQFHKGDRWKAIAKGCIVCVCHLQRFEGCVQLVGCAKVWFDSI